MITVLDYLKKYLTKEDYTKAVADTYARPLLDKECDNVEDAVSDLCRTFQWDKSDNGQDFWNSVYDTLIFVKPSVESKPNVLTFSNEELEVLKLACRYAADRLEDLAKRHDDVVPDNSDNIFKRILHDTENLQAKITDYLYENRFC